MEKEQGDVNHKVKQRCVVKLGSEVTKTKDFGVLYTAMTDVQDPKSVNQGPSCIILGCKKDDTDKRRSLG